PQLLANKISNASASGVVISGQAQPTFKDNTFTGNQPFHIQNSSSYAIAISKNAFEPPASELTILGNTED
ncbi:MAG: right-handed parallel beta-helix repeat-containing protein, partial [Pseudomonadales bacterium]